MAYGVDIPEPSRTNRKTYIEKDDLPQTPKDEFDEGTLSQYIIIFDSLGGKILMLKVFKIIKKGKGDKYEDEKETYEC